MKWADKPIRYEKHALRRFAQRGVSEDQALGVIRKPDQKGKARRKGALRLEKAISKRRRLVVIVEEEASFIRAITAFWK